MACGSHWRCPIKIEIKYQGEKTGNTALHERNHFFKEISNSLEKTFFNDLKSTSNLYPLALVKLHGNMKNKNSHYSKSQRFRYLEKGMLDSSVFIWEKWSQIL